MKSNFRRKIICYAFLAGILHCFAWSLLIYDLRNSEFQDIEKRPVLLVSAVFTDQDPYRHASSYWRLYLKLKNSNSSQAEIQTIIPDHPIPMLHEFHEHHGKDITLVAWVNKRSGQIVDVFPPAAPEFLTLFYILLPTLGLVTALCIAVGFLPDAKPFDSNI
ncbi:hypothetical protein [Undibacterium sp. RuTC16W]|uniref:hypothetical protein n=1 Tax=Undibacterium sp. RuTC16W TaxID=3413048 RepID=UPI003BF33C9C